MCAEIPQKVAAQKGAFNCSRQFYNGAVLMKLVPYKGQDTHPNGVAFYVNNGQGGVIGIRVYPDGRKVTVNPFTNITDGTKFPTRRRYSQRYLRFRHAWGEGIAIYASHAVYTAWSDKPIQPIPKGMTIDHIDGVAQNNDFRNLRCVSNEINNRDGGFLSKLRHMGFHPARIDRAYLLRFYERMAKIKASITNWQYRKLTKEQLRSILFLPDEELQIDSLIKTLKTKKSYAKRFEKTEAHHAPSKLSDQPIPRQRQQGLRHAGRVGD